MFAHDVLDAIEDYTYASPRDGHAASGMCTRTFLLGGPCNIVSFFRSIPRDDLYSIVEQAHIYAHDYLDGTVFCN